ncbi:DUF4124 domain-containing protein [Marinobacter sp. chi1]|uniref:DUF4124 domain-containing protein n=2 Tax=Marinobacter suaedae TaxID=3057675 RepID=A0ABT8VY08_9GAMM|nr:DUF4124 domain-containing protein [Marinobacter sp. chi1]MDO3720818.1 DUF4124 domain-containing protein [Marinobacter sp. chi1]
MPRILASFVFAGIYSASVQAEVYSWTDREGVAHFSDQPPDTEVHQKLRMGSPSIVPMSENLEQERRVRGIREDVRNLISARSQAAPTSDGDLSKARARRQQACEQYRRRLSNIQSELRAGYTNTRGNTLRRQRRELSQQLSRDCILR